MASNYAQDWQAAKEKFENATGMKKPAAKGKLLFITWRKGSGIEDALEDLDKVVDSYNPNEPDEKHFKKWEGLVDTVNKKATAYLKMLEDAIKKEKDESGKTEQYRHMKILKASLETIASRAEQKYKDTFQYYQLWKAKGGQNLDRIEAILKNLKTLGTNLKAGVAKGTKFCQEVLADPTPANWNRINTDDGARSSSQSISNIVKYVYADYPDLLIKGNAKELEVLEDDRIRDQIQKLNVILGNLTEDIMALGKESGTSAADGSLAFLANKAQSHLPDTASKPEVIAAAKRFAGMMKKCSEISQQLLRFGQ